MGNYPTMDRTVIYADVKRPVTFQNIHVLLVENCSRPRDKAFSLGCESFNCYDQWTTYSKLGLEIKYCMGHQFG